MPVNTGGIVAGSTDRLSGSGEASCLMCGMSHARHAQHLENLSEDHRPSCVFNGLMGHVAGGCGGAACQI